VYVSKILFESPLPITGVCLNDYPALLDGVLYYVGVGVSFSEPLLDDLLVDAWGDYYLLVLFPQQVESSGFG
jgi:hypothetical protein